MPTRLTLRTELLAMRAEDHAVREKLLQSGELQAGYHPEMEAVHTRNAARMRQILARYGWPTRTLVGVDGEEAAWMIVFHAIGNPDLQRQSRGLLKQAVADGEAPAWQWACLWDRIASFEDQPQRYGTHCDFDDGGYYAVYRLEAPERVNELRETVGLGPLEPPSRASQTPRSADQLAKHRAEFEAWAKKAGWRE